MSEPRRGRPPNRFAIRRVRLVGFHNFVDETIELDGGGHLFLLGDNGSGKTALYMQFASGSQQLIATEP